MNGRENLQPEKLRKGDTSRMNMKFRSYSSATAVLLDCRRVGLSGPERVRKGHRLLQASLRVLVLFVCGVKIGVGKPNIDFDISVVVAFLQFRTLSRFIGP